MGCVVNVRELQRKLRSAAPAACGYRRGRALYDRICRDDVLWEAWERVRVNRGAAGVDRVTLAYVQEEYGVRRLVAELQQDLREGTYRPAPARRVDIPKPDGSERPLGIPAVRGRVARQAAKIVLEPIFEADFLPCSYGFRPKRSATQAMERLRTGFIEGCQHVAESGIRSFFGEISHFRARMSGRLREQRRIIRYYLHRWPSQRAMKRFREKVRARTGRNRVGRDIRDVIADLNPLLRGWGNYFRTGNAADKFRQADEYVLFRLHRLMVKKRGRNLRAGQAQAWTEEWFNGHGLHRLRGTVRYPKAA
jgi:retron-type reverse transcriptase